MGFRSLRVINDDKIAAGRGFPTHPHRDMEIISYVLEGSLQHKDSTGKGAIITPDDIQMMSAGTGITHSEYNPSPTDSNHFLQIWIEPAMRGVRPRYSDNKVTADQKRNRWNFIAGPDDSGAAVGIYQDAKIFASKLQSRREPRLHARAKPSRLAASRHRRDHRQRHDAEGRRRGRIQSSDRPARHRCRDADVLLFDLA